MTNYHWMKITRWLYIVAVLLFVFTLLHSEGAAPLDMEPRLDQLTLGFQFNFVTWELQAIGTKLLYGILAPQQFMTEEQRAQFALDFLADIHTAHTLENDIERIFTDPAIPNPATASQPAQTDLAALRTQMRRTAPLAEAILSEQVSVILHTGGFGPLHQILPPVSGTFTPLPHLLIISPRDHTEMTHQRQLIAGLNAADFTTLEQASQAELPDHSAYVTRIGGLALYPAMLLESSSIDWVVDVIAHEWTHHRLLLHPLGLQYDRSGETRTINETTASLIGEWAGQAVIHRYYAPTLQREKHLPNPLHQTRPTPDAPEPPRFDYRAAMHHTRVIADQLLAEGKILQAEWYMEARRRYIVANGYHLRKLNQAYFAFHGAYAASPGGGAAGQDPIGPAVRRLWAISATPRDFVRTIAPYTTLAEVNTVLP